MAFYQFYCIFPLLAKNNPFQIKLMEEDFFFSLWAHLQYMEVPGPGFESEM